MRWLLRLYPRAWRRRYGAEMEAHLAQTGGGWREAFDLGCGSSGGTRRSSDLNELQHEATKATKTHKGVDHRAYAISRKGTPMRPSPNFTHRPV